MVKHVLRPGMQILDIGANIGWFAFHEAANIGKKGFVYAIEPIADNVDAIKRGIKENNFKNMQVFECAIGNKN
jgi:FkbM family methyltransferase